MRPIPATLAMLETCKLLELPPHGDLAHFKRTRRIAGEAGDEDGARDRAFCDIEANRQIVLLRRLKDLVLADR